jgi:hypothetical protein
MSDPPTNPPSRPVQVKIEVPANLDATYANFSVISHTPSEVFLDFAQLLPQQPTARIQTRVVMTPLNAKLVLRALGENIAKFEAQYGEIQLPAQGSSLAQQLFGFRPPKPEGEE